MLFSSAAGTDVSRVNSQVLTSEPEPRREASCVLFLLLSVAKKKIIQQTRLLVMLSLPN